MNPWHAGAEPTRAEVDALPGATLLEFGTPSCGYCRAIEPMITAVVAGHPHLRHLKIVDGRGHPLGRSFGVRQWPTLIFLRDGAEVARLVRPGDAGSIRNALAQVDHRPSA